MKQYLCRLSSPRILAAFVLGVSAVALGTAYISQYVFHYDPCVLCLYQRKPWWAVIVLAGLALFLAGRRPAWARRILWLCAVAFAVGSGIALYHTGVEQQWWAGTQACGDTTLPPAGDIEALKAYLANRNIVRCDVPTWKVFGLSMTVYNLIASATMAVFTACMLRCRKTG
jgi:disulfide bond formation protein DsbB